MYKTTFNFSLFSFLLPIVASADVFDVLDLGIDALTSAIPLFVTLASVAFLWGVVRFVAHADDEKAVAEGKQVMVWGLLALFVIVSLWGIIGFITDTLQLEEGVDDPITVPTEPL